MKKPSLFQAALLTLVGAGLLAAPARAAITTYAKDDLFIGFYDASGASSKDYLVNIGQASAFRDAAPGAVMSLGTFGADLNTAFDITWTNDQNIRWFVFGATYNVPVGSDPEWTLYASAQEAIVGTTRTAYTVLNADSQATIANPINDVGNAFKNKTSTAGHANGLLQNTTVSNSLYSESNGIELFGTYTTGSFANGTAGTVLDLFRMRGGVATDTGELGTLEGKFKINDAGAITFTAAAPVPEPSAYGLIIAAGAVLLVIVRRIRKTQTA